MFTVIVSLAVVVSILLILIVLIQNSKGGGLSSQFGGSETSRWMGVKKTGDVLEKMTWGLAIALFVLSLTANLTDSESNEDFQQEFSSPNIENIQGSPITNPIIPGNTGESENSDLPIIPSDESTTNPERENTQDKTSPEEAENPSPTEE